MPQAGEGEVRCCPQVILHAETPRSSWSERTGKVCLFRACWRYIPGLPGIKVSEAWRLLSVDGARGGKYGLSSLM